MNKSISNISSFLKENYELIITCKQNCYISSSSLNYKCKKIVMEQHIYKEHENLIYQDFLQLMQM